MVALGGVAFSYARGTPVGAVRVLIRGSPLWSMAFVQRFGESSRANAKHPPTIRWRGVLSPQHPSGCCVPYGRYIYLGPQKHEQECLAQRKTATPYGHHRTLCRVLLSWPRGALFLVNPCRAKDACTMVLGGVGRRHPPALTRCTGCAG